MQKTAYEMRISDWSSDVCSSDLFRVAFVGLGRLGFGLVDELAVDLDPTDEQQAGLEAHTLLAGTLALGVGEGVGPQVAQAEADHHLLLGVDRLNAAAHQVLRFRRSEEHTSELQSLMRISYAVFCLIKKTHIPLSNTLSRLLLHTANNYTSALHSHAEH